MQTTKKSPFTQFDPNYYKALKRISFAQAEVYRQSVVRWTKNTIDLWKQEDVSELKIRWINEADPDRTREENARAIQNQRVAWSIDLAEAFESGKLPENDLHTAKGKEIMEWVERLKQETQAPIDLSWLLDWTITEEEVNAQLWIAPEEEEWEEEIDDGKTDIPTTVEVPVEVETDTGNDTDVTTNENNGNELENNGNAGISQESDKPEEKAPELENKGNEETAIVSAPQPVPPKPKAVSKAQSKIPANFQKKI